MTTQSGRSAEEEFQPVTEEQLAEQLAYYSSRAGEYDDWWLRRGPFDKGEAANEVWFREAELVRSVLHAIDLGDDVLELAPGTGTWSVHLAPRARNLLLVDGSAEMLAHNPAAKEEQVRTEIADLFTWETDERFDTIVFTFWISHVPRERLRPFFRSLGRWLRPGGRLFFVDDLPLATTEPHVDGAAGQTMTRRLNSGESATIVKNFYPAAELAAAAGEFGIDLEVRESETYFQYGTGRRR
ncbi:class I SAM-dependent methyltransferase [Streptomyces sp. NPDC088196]|uniref:class I SAM-dependent methyltransferase n=1 Tax=Streptomyces sp. NPDC088196 TaxID=3154868 RepID=UPI00344CD743